METRTSTRKREFDETKANSQQMDMSTSSDSKVIKPKIKRSMPSKKEKTGLMSRLAFKKGKGQTIKEKKEAIMQKEEAIKLKEEELMMKEQAMKEKEQAMEKVKEVGKNNNEEKGVKNGDSVLFKLR